MVEEQLGAATAAADACAGSPGAQQQQQQQNSHSHSHSHSHRDPADASPVIPSQAVPVVGVPSYPNCIAWSDENLLAVGAGHLVTILDPASMSGPRGFIPVTPSPVFNFGRVQPDDLKAHSLFDLCLARDPRPVVRSIGWSPQGLAQNGGSLLAMCTTDGRLKVYRPPFCDFQSDWVEVIDLTEMVFNYGVKNDFREAQETSKRLAVEEEAIPPPVKWGFRMKRKLPDDEEPQHRKVQKAKFHATESLAVVAVAEAVPNEPPIPIGERLEEGGVAANDAQRTAVVKGSRVEVLEEDDCVQYWVGGLVAEIANGEALVRLDRPQYGAMEEWVPLQAMDVSDPGAETNRQSSGEQVIQTERPRIRPQVAIATVESTWDEVRGERSLPSGELVEAWVNDRWQEGTVAEVLEGSGASVTFPPSSTATVVELKNLRPAPLWQGRRWIWKGTADEIPNQKTSVPCRDSNDGSVGQQDLSNHCSERQDVVDEQTEGHVQRGVGRMRGQVTTTLALYRGQDDGSCRQQQSTSGQDLLQDAYQEGKEKLYARVYKRRAPAAGAASTKPPGDAVSPEVSTGRPVRNRRLPSKLRNGETASLTTEADGPTVSGQDLEPGNDSQGKDGDYLLTMKVKGVKDGNKANKPVRPLKETPSKLNKAKSANEARSGADTEKEKKGKSGSTPKPNWISPHDYAARSEYLTPLSVAWSAKYEDHQGADDRGAAGGGLGAPKRFVLLGAGMKSGRVSLWRMDCPSSYSIDHSDGPATAAFLGFLFAHQSRVNSLCWASCSNFELGKLNARDIPLDSGHNPSGDTFLLATGCADGSVKLWAGFSRELTGSEPGSDDTLPLVLLREVVEADSEPVTSLALSVPPRSGERALLAVGKGSGSVGIWELHSSGAFRRICLHYYAHCQLVTGFSWAPDGRSLYSCGQDSLKRWEVSDDQLLPLPFPDSSSLFQPSSASDICSLEALESFYGTALSPNGLALATVRGIASDQLDQMYQARSQKGMVQLFWLGNEHLDVKPTNHALLSDSALIPKRALSGHETACWELNVIEALEGLQDLNKPFVLWDLVTALLSLKEKLGTQGVVSMLSKWLSGWGQGQGQGQGQEQGAVGAVDPRKRTTGSFQRAIPEASCRRLQLMTVLYRRLLLSHVKGDLVRGHSSDDPIEGDDDTEEKVWKDGLDFVEHELRQRLVHIQLGFLQNAGSEGDDSEVKDCSESSSPLRRQLLVEWVLGNAHSVDPQLGKQAATLQATKKNRYVCAEASSPMEEVCTFCDASVTLESPEIATCIGFDSKHRLQRCSVSMQVCPPVCLWHCSCCGRSAVKLAPLAFFSLSSREQLTELSLSVLDHADSIPSCPFCGILMSRLLPNFFLTPSLV